MPAWWCPQANTLAELAGGAPSSRSRSSVLLRGRWSAITLMARAFHLPGVRDKGAAGGGVLTGRHPRRRRREAGTRRPPQRRNLASRGSTRWADARHDLDARGLRVVARQQAGAVIPDHWRARTAAQLDDALASGGRDAPGGGAAESSTRGEQWWAGFPHQFQQPTWELVGGDTVVDRLALDPHRPRVK